MATAGKVYIETDCIGRRKVFLNGEDISRYVRGFTVIGNVGDLNIVELRLVAGVEIDIETQQITTHPVVLIDNTSVEDTCRWWLPLKTRLKEIFSVGNVPLELERFANKYNEAKKRGLI